MGSFNYPKYNNIQAKNPIPMIDRLANQDINSILNLRLFITISLLNLAIKKEL